MRSLVLGSTRPLLDRVTDLLVGFGRNLAGTYSLTGSAYLNPVASDRSQIASTWQLLQAVKDLKRQEFANSLLSEKSFAERTSVATEKEFLLVGAHIEEISEASSNLLARTRELCELAIDENDQSKFANSFQLVESSLRFNHECLSAVQKIKCNLQHASLSVTELEKVEGRLYRVMAPLEIVRLMLKMQCSGLPADVQSLFSGLIEEMKSIQEQMAARLQSEFIAFRSVGVSIRRVLNRLTQLEVEQLTVQARRETVNHSLLRLDEQLRGTHQRQQSLNDCSSRIAAQVSSLVQAVQMQDISSQRISHVCTGIGDLVTKLERLASTAHDDLQNELSSVVRGAQVQAAQVASLKEQLYSTKQRVENGFNSLAEVIGELKTESLSQHKLHIDIQSTERLVGELLQMFTDVNTVMSRTLEATHSISSTLAPIRDITSTVNEFVTDLSVKMRYVALNSQVHAARQQDAAALDVLSAAACQIATLSAEIGTNVSGEVQKISNAVTDSVRSFETMQRTIQHEVAAFGAQNRSEGHRLREYCSAAEALMESIAKAFCSLENAAIKGLADSANVSVEAEHFENTIAVLQRLVAVVPRTVLAESQLDDSQYARYTMESEREVHRTLNGESAEKEMNSAEDSVEFF